MGTQDAGDDLTAGVKYLIAQGTVDAKRVGIVGGSFDGGYATLAGVASHPRCVRGRRVDCRSLTPHDVVAYHSAVLGSRAENPAYSRMADPDTPDGMKLLEAESPLNSAANIKTPLMGGAGR